MEVGERRGHRSQSLLTTRRFVRLILTKLWCIGTLHQRVKFWLGPRSLSRMRPVSFFIRSNGHYFVIYSLPDGKAFVAELTVGGTCYEMVRQTRFLGHQVRLDPK